MRGEANGSGEGQGGRGYGNKGERGRESRRGSRSKQSLLVLPGWAQARQGLVLSRGPTSSLAVAQCALHAELQPASAVIAQIVLPPQLLVYTAAARLRRYQEHLRKTWLRARQNRLARRERRHLCNGIEAKRQVGYCAASLCSWVSTWRPPLSPSAHLSLAPGSFPVTTHHRVASRAFYIGLKQHGSVHRWDVDSTRPSFTYWKQGEVGR